MPGISAIISEELLQMTIKDKGGVFMFCKEEGREATRVKHTSSPKSSRSFVKTEEMLILLPEQKNPKNRDPLPIKQVNQVSAPGGGFLCSYALCISSHHPEYCCDVKCTF